MKLPVNNRNIIHHERRIQKIPKIRTFSEQVHEVFW